MLGIPWGELRERLSYGELQLWRAEMGLRAWEREQG